MRTTITLEPDVEALVRRLMRERDLSFKEAVNLAIRTGLTSGDEAPPFNAPTRNLGVPLIPLDKALTLAGDLEDEHLVRKLSVRK
jgi:hypothetical protein